MSYFKISNIYCLCVPQKCTIRGKSHDSLIAASFMWSGDTAFLRVYILNFRKRQGLQTSNFLVPHVFRQWVQEQDSISKGWLFFPFITSYSNDRQEQDKLKTNLKSHFKEPLASERESTRLCLVKMSITYLYKTLMHGDTTSPNPSVVEKYIK